VNPSGLHHVLRGRSDGFGQGSGGGGRASGSRGVLGLVSVAAVGAVLVFTEVAWLRQPAADADVAVASAAVAAAAAGGAFVGGAGLRMPWQPLARGPGDAATALWAAEGDDMLAEAKAAAESAKLKLQAAKLRAELDAVQESTRGIGAAPVEAEVVEPAAAGIQAAGPGPVEVEVVSVSGSRPQKLLFAPAVQSFVAVLTRLKNAPTRAGSSSDSALGVVLGKIGQAMTSWDEEEDNVPADVEADFDEMLVVGSAFVETWNPADGDWRLAAAAFSKCRLARRLPEVVDRIAPWDEILPPDLAASSGVSQAELRSTSRGFLTALNLDEMSSWSEAEMQEASDLIERNVVLKEVFDALDKAFEVGIGELLGGAALTATAALLTPVILLVLLVAAIWSAFGGGGDGASTVPGAESFASLPLYGLGSGGGAGGGGSS